MSQKRLAYLVGSSIRAISDYEQGRRLPPLKVAMLLEIVLSAKVSEIYVDWYRSLNQQIVTREDALLGSRHEIRSRLLGKD
jgi:DNA-binding XRE family transcriptional regulator